MNDIHVEHDFPPIALEQPFTAEQHRKFGQLHWRWTIALNRAKNAPRTHYTELSKEQCEEDREDRDNHRVLKWSQHLSIGKERLEVIKIKGLWKRQRFCINLEVGLKGTQDHDRCRNDDCCRKE